MVHSILNRATSLKYLGNEIMVFCQPQAPSPQELNVINRENLEVYAVPAPQVNHGLFMINCIFVRSSLLDIVPSHSTGRPDYGVSGIEALRYKSSNCSQSLRDFHVLRRRALHDGHTTFDTQRGAIQLAEQRLYTGSAHYVSNG